MQTNSGQHIHVWKTCLLVCSIVAIIFTVGGTIPIGFIMLYKDRVIFNIISLIYIAWVTINIIISLIVPHGGCYGYCSIFYLKICKYCELPLGIAWGIGGTIWDSYISCVGELCGLVVLPWMCGQLAAIIGAAFAIFAHNEAIRKIIAVKGDPLNELITTNTAA